MTDETLQTALKLRELGFAIHWLRPGTKIPLLHGWAKAPVLSAEELRQQYRRGFNVGFRPGLPSLLPGDRAIVVLDVDVRGGPDHQAEAHAEALKLMGSQSFDVVSGSQVGRHKFFACPLDRLPPVAATKIAESSTRVDGKPAWMLELLSTGKNCVLPPSVHPDTKMQYRWSLQ